MYKWTIEFVALIDGQTQEPQPTEWSMAIDVHCASAEAAKQFVLGLPNVVSVKRVYESHSVVI